MHQSIFPLANEPGSLAEASDRECSLGRNALSVARRNIAPVAVLGVLFFPDKVTNEESAASAPPVHVILNGNITRDKTKGSRRAGPRRATARNAVRSRTCHFVVHEISNELALLAIQMMGKSSNDMASNNDTPLQMARASHP